MGSGVAGGGVVAGARGTVCWGAGREWVAAAAGDWPGPLWEHPASSSAQQHSAGNRQWLYFMVVTSYSLVLARIRHSCLRNPSYHRKKTGSITKRLQWNRKPPPFAGRGFYYYTIRRDCPWAGSVVPAHLGGVYSARSAHPPPLGNAQQGGDKQRAQGDAPGNAKGAQEGLDECADVPPYAIIHGLIDGKAGH